MVLQLIIIIYFYSIYFVKPNICVLQNDFTRISLEEASCLIATEVHGVSQDLHYLMCAERKSYVMLLFTVVRMKFKRGATTEFDGKFYNAQSFSNCAVWTGYGWDAFAEALWEQSPTLAACLCQGPFFVPLQHHSPSLPLSLNKKRIIVDRNKVTWNNSSPEKIKMYIYI